ncbi:MULTISPECIES: sensor histidine kinase [Lacticaseibacillus]|uniref:histidine kinase n=1 Tax=Lacticaseibacillus casei DSM 20011 = JCM 1134 = ATCC 393 TaxID=1423732 RepID=A0AAD1ESM3_LACCA|nr:sensor histidine kinase [Lacticaseibacillus casei]MBI6598210.1 sensor histidine kinase [Lacticaseibacillus casei]MBO1480493.1 sensor histidine kinase [Lacticaseibacillus casei]MBO2415697.1 sensor histidine kinase [Lacticaseibacillus casei]MCK2080144.1 sensor histidine kinase [Lacticaseibacillus casei]MDZ5495911.1 sensor histidine kinase [Lacticaseibacillus casei]
MIKAYYHARWMVWLSLLTLLLTGLLANWLVNVSIEVILNMWLFALIPLLVIGGYDLWRFNREWQQLQEGVSLLDDTQITDPLGRAYYQKIQSLQQTVRKNSDTYRDREQEMLDTLQLWTHQIKTRLTALDLLLQVEPFNANDARLEISKINRYLTVMLNYLKLTTLNTDLVLTEVALKPLANETVRDLAKLFIAKDLTVSVEALPTVVSDSQWLRFIFEQLLTNAIKYTPRGSIRIYAKGDAVFVADMGIGILPEDLPRIFEQGHSGYNGRATQKASGLGLFLSRQIAEKLGLRLTVTSKVGVGSTFAIHFPQTRWLAE